MQNPFLKKPKLVNPDIPVAKLIHWSPFTKLISWVLILCLLNLVGGCMNYFKVQKTTGSITENVTNFQNQDKTIIIHLEDQAWTLNTPELVENELIGVTRHEYLSTLKNPLKTKGANRYRTKKDFNERHVLNEVHIYVSELKRLSESNVSIPLTAIQKIEIYEKDQAATIGSWTLGIIGGYTLAASIFMVIVLLIKSSCPFIYTFNGENYQLAGEIYSGSIQPQLERHDFLKLPVYNSKTNNYQLKISNEVKEVQHTNLMELWVFDHNENEDILVDKYGKHYVVTDLITPASAKNINGIEVIELIENKDSLFYTSTEITSELPLTDGLILESPNPKTTDVAKLTIKAKNSFVLDYMLGQFQNQFGDLYPKWTKQQRKAPTQQLQNWSLNQNIPLSLKVERNGKWETVDYFNIAGPIAMKEDILAIPLDGSESDPLKVKLEFGNFFWEIDYVGIDYSPDTEISYKVIPVKNAISQEGKDVSKKLKQDDRKYYIQPNVGDNALVDFELPSLSAEKRTIFLHSKGWYQILRDPTGTPDREYLEAFRQPGRFNQFVNEYIQSYTNK